MLSVQPLGGVMDSIQNVLEDPALPTVVDLTKRIAATFKKPPATTTTPKPSTPKPSTPGVPGIGLQKLVDPLRGYLWTRQHPVQTKLILAGVILTPFLLAFGLGRWTKRCRA